MYESQGEMKITRVVTTEEMVLNEDYRSLRQARIEVWTDDKDQHFAYEVGHIRVWDDPVLFQAVRDAIERS